MSIETIAAEIEGLHEFIQQWFNGSVTKTAAVFARLAAAWPEGYSLVDPHNKLHCSAELLASTFELHGKFPNLAINIKNVSVRSFRAGVAVAVYEEWHVDSSETEARLCSAVFDVEAEHPPHWVHIHESQLSICADAL